MGKLRTRVKGSKGKRWAKGHSSSSNPSISKHRDAAKNNFFQPFLLNSKPTSGEPMTKSALTEEALKQHTLASQSGTSFVSKPSAPSESIAAPPSVFDGQFDHETSSVGSGTTFRSIGSFKTFATGFSNCSNMSFSKLYKGFTPSSALHREMLAVLAAITEVIKQQGGKETDTEYYAALMTTLDVAEASEDSLGATLCLLGMIIKRVPASVLKLKFSSSAKTLLELLGRHIESDNSVIVRSLIGCLGVLLRNQDASVWAASSTLQVYDALLTFVTNPKSKVRKSAQHAICSILKGSTLLTEGEDPPLLHPVASRTAKYCIKFIEEQGFSGNSSPLLHLLNLLKEIFTVFPQSEVKTLSESLLKLMTLNNILVTSCAMQCFHDLLKSRPKTVTLPAELNARLISALFDYQPSLNDTQPLGGWLAVMTQAHLNLGRLEPVLCAGHLPRFFAVATQLWLSERPEIVQAVTPSLASLLTECLEPALGSDSSLKSQAEKIVKNVEQSLGFQFVGAWKYVIHLSTSLIEAVGKTHPQLLVDLLRTLASLRASPGFNHVAEVDFTVGKAVRVCGPRFVLTKCVPLNITGQEVDYDFPNSWILPILRENTTHTDLAFFVEYFLPLAQTCHSRVAKCQAEQDRVGFRVFDLLQRQMWALLPGFCKYPTDVDRSLKTIAKTMGQAISERPDIRMDVMAALRQLIIHSEDDEKIRIEISRYTKNYLPLLFNLYTTKAAKDEEEAHRYSAYETINYFLKIADTSLVNSLFDSAKSKLEAASEKLKSNDSAVVEENKFVWESVLDLLKALVVYQDQERIESFVQLCLPWILGAEAKAQKKAYRIIEHILNAETEVCSQHVRQNVKRISKLFATSREAVKTTSKASRLRSLARLVCLLENEPTTANHRFLNGLLTEAVAGVKEVGEKARSAASDLLIRIGQVFKKWASSHPDSERQFEWFKKYVTFIMKGLDSKKDAQVVNAIVSMTYVVHEFASSCNEEIIDGILERICHLLDSSTRDVVLACLGFIRMFVVTVHSQRLPVYLKRLVDSLSAMNEEHQRAYRIKTRDIFIRLMRKCGAELVIKLVPEDDVVLLKRLNNLRKIEARKKKLKSDKNDRKEDDEDDEDNLATQPKTMDHVLADSDDEDDLEEEDVRDSRKRNTAKAWIQESEDIVDFLDPTAAQKVSATHPKTSHAEASGAKRKKTENPFKTAADGRLIIDDDDDSDSSDKDSDEGGLSEALDNLAVGRKRKAGGQSRQDEENDSYEPAFKYQAGGSGIHRPVGTFSVASSRHSSSSIKRKMTSAMKAKLDKAQQENKTVDYGADYRSSKAKGDVKRKGKPDPFAYVPLNKSALNKRKKAKLSGQFKGLVRAARKGATVGAKNRIRNKSRGN